jgi:hypothetical protein
MNVSRTDPIERVARVLAELKLSWNGHGEMRSAGSRKGEEREGAASARMLRRAVPLFRRSGRGRAGTGHRMNLMMEWFSRYIDDVSQGLRHMVPLVMFAV